MFHFYTFWNLRFSDVFRGYRSGTFVKIGLIYFSSSLTFPFPLSIKLDTRYSIKIDKMKNTNLSKYHKNHDLIMTVKSHN